MSKPLDMIAVEENARSSVSMDLLHHNFHSVAFHPTKKNWIVCVERNKYPAGLDHYQIVDKNYDPKDKAAQDLNKKILESGQEEAPKLNSLLGKGIKNVTPTNEKNRESGSVTPNQEKKGGKVGGLLGKAGGMLAGIGGKVV
jgi:hypothetical protein